MSDFLLKRLIIPLRIGILRKFQVLEIILINVGIRLQIHDDLLLEYGQKVCLEIVVQKLAIIITFLSINLLDSRIQLNEKYFRLALVERE